MKVISIDFKLCRMLRNDVVGQGCNGRISGPCERDAWVGMTWKMWFIGIGICGSLCNL